MFPTIPWTEVDVSGALSDSLVTDFGLTVYIANPSAIPSLDWTLCLESLEYGSAASVAVELYFAETPLSAAEDRKQIVNDTLQYFIWPSVEVPRAPTGLPWQLFITKDATNANIGFRYRWIKPSGC